LKEIVRGENPNLACTQLVAGETSYQRLGAPMSGPVEQSVPGRLLDLLVETIDLRQILATVTELAVETVPGCESASVTVIYERDPATVVSSDERAQAVDEAQYEAGAGPCLEAAGRDQIVQVDDVATAHIRGRWQQVALNAGIGATLSMPIASVANIAAGLNLYSGSVCGWPDEAVGAADLLTTYAGDAVTLAYRLNGETPLVEYPHEPEGGTVLPWRARRKS
jgi:hypothetical protein